MVWALLDKLWNDKRRRRLHLGPISPADLLRISSAHWLMVAHSAQVAAKAARNRSTSLAVTIRGGCTLKTRGFDLATWV